jgi:hypothetical protein
MYAKFAHAIHPDAEIDKFNYDRYSGRKGDDRAYEQLLLARSKQAQSLPMAIAQPVPPHLSHNPFRIEIGSGQANSKSFSFFELRPLVHELMELDDGYTRFSTVELLRAQIRRYAMDRWELNSATFFRLENLVPYFSYDHQISYRFSANLVKPGHFSQEAGGGQGMDLIADKQFAYYLAGARFEEAKEFSRGYKPMGWAELGYIVTPLPTWKVWLAEQYSHQFIRFDDRTKELRLIFEVANYLTKDWELKSTLQRLGYLESDVKPQTEVTLSASLHL